MDQPGTMTEAEWLGSMDPKRILDYHVRRATGRQLRLFAVAGARDMFAHNPDPGQRGQSGDDGAYEAAIGRAEALADGGRIAPPADSLPMWAEQPDARQAAYVVLGADADVGLWLDDPAVVVPAAIQSFSVNPVLWMRCIFGNPFRPVTVDPRWLTSDVLALARGIYDDLAFDRLPILADALQDAGCDDEQVLAHCRSERPHVRGRWVVDLVLSKE